MIRFEVALCFKGPALRAFARRLEALRTDPSSACPVIRLEAICRFKGTALRAHALGGVAALLAHSSTPVHLIRCEGAVRLHHSTARAFLPSHRQLRLLVLEQACARSEGRLCQTSLLGQGQEPTLFNS